MRHKGTDGHEGERSPVRVNFGREDVGMER